MDPETGDFTSKLREMVSEYDQFSQELMSKIEQMLHEVLEALGGEFPNAADIQCMSEACGLPTAAIRNWCKPLFLSTSSPR